MLIIYKKLGETGKVTETFLQCQKAMRQHMDTDPDEVTVNLYLDILDNKYIK